MINNRNSGLDMRPRLQRYCNDGASTCRYITRERNIEIELFCPDSSTSNLELGDGVTFRISNQARHRLIGKSSASNSLTFSPVLSPLNSTLGHIVVTNRNLCCNLRVTDDLAPLRFSLG